MMILGPTRFMTPYRHMSDDVYMHNTQVRHSVIALLNPAYIRHILPIRTVLAPGYLKTSLCPRQASDSAVSSDT